MLELVDEQQEADPMFQLQSDVVRLQKLASVDNAAEAFEDEDLGKLGSLCVQEYKLDLQSREDWEASARRAMDIAKQIRKPKTTPWEGASNVKYPMLTVAALQFAARAYPAIVDGMQIVKCRVKGKDIEGLKAARAERVSVHMSHQFMVDMPCWEDDTDTLLHQIPIVGCAFRKVYPTHDNDAGCNSELVSAFDLVVNAKAKSLKTVPRVTHVIELYPYEITERQRDGRFLDVPLDLDQSGEDTSEPHKFLEQHRWWDSDGDGMPEPWIVTVHEDTQKVVRLVANYDAEDIKVNPHRGQIAKLPKRKDIRFVMIPFMPDPDGGFYAIGFGKLLESISDVVDTTINQMMDAGTLQNAGGGFIGSGLKLGKSKIRQGPGFWQNVDAPGQDIRAAIVPMTHQGPAPVLFELLGLMLEAGKDISAVKDILTGESQQQMTATTTMALIEQGLKVFSSIFKRILRAIGDEFECVYEINRKFLNVPRYVALLDDPVQVGPQDYADDMDVMPVADPNNVTDMQRAARAEFLLNEVRNGNPLVNPMTATRRALEAMRIENIEEVLVPPPDGPSPQEMAEADKAAADVEKSVADAEKTRVGAMKEGAEAVRLMAENVALGIPPLAEPPPNPQAEQPLPPGPMPTDPMGGPPGMDPGMAMGMPQEQPGMAPPDFPVDQPFGPAE